VASLLSAFALLHPAPSGHVVEHDEVRALEPGDEDPPLPRGAALALPWKARERMGSAMPRTTSNRTTSSHASRSMWHSARRPSYPNESSVRLPSVGTVVVTCYLSCSFSTDAWGADGSPGVPLLFFSLPSANAAMFPRLLPR